MGRWWICEWLFSSGWRQQWWCSSNWRYVRNFDHSIFAYDFTIIPILKFKIAADIFIVKRTRSLSLTLSVDRTHRFTCMCSFAQSGIYFVVLSSKCLYFRICWHVSAKDNREELIMWTYQQFSFVYSMYITLTSIINKNTVSSNPRTWLNFST